MYRSHRVSRPAGCWLLLLLLAVGACGYAGTRNRPVVPDDLYGHRHEVRQEYRQTLEITPPDSNRSYFYYPVIVDSLHVRHEPFDPARPADAQSVDVEVLIKGTLPDDCSELHALDEWRAGHIIHLTLEMRRPTGAVCSPIGRPFRFYLTLGGEYRTGDYIIKMNGDVYPFVIQPPPP